MLPPQMNCSVCGHDVDPRAPDFLLECHFCGRWLHGACAQVSEQDALLVAKFACASCRSRHDGVKFEPTANNGPFDADAMSFSPLPVHLGAASTPVQLRHKKSASSFRRLLGAAMYARSGVHLVPSQDVQPHFLQHHALDEPVLIAGNSHRAASLDEPFPALDAAVVAKVLADNHVVRATDVTTQTRQELTASMWEARLARSPQSNQQQEDDAALLVNAEFRLQQTPMQMLVAAPLAVTQVDWKYLASGNGSDHSSGAAANSNVFGAFLERNAYLDFTLAPGGQCTWLSVSSGELWVYLIPPENLEAFRDWKSDPDFATAFLAERVNKCIKCVVSAGSTLLIPAGWMYARFAGGVQSCSEFHGLFACTAAMEAQLGVVMLELQHEALAQYCSETTCGWLSVDANAQLWTAVCSYVRQLLMPNNGMNARVSELDRRALNRALPRLRAWSALPTSLKSINGITWTPSSLQEAHGIVSQLEQALVATYVPGHNIHDIQPTNGLASDKILPISPNEATYIYSAASVPDTVSESPWEPSSTGFDSNNTSNFNSSTPMWSTFDPIQHNQQDHLVVSTQNQTYLHSDSSLHQQTSQAFGGAGYEYMQASGATLENNQGFMAAPGPQVNLGLEGLNALGNASTQSLELGMAGTTMAPGHNFQQPQLDSNGNYVDMLMRHRASCHRCGNLRKKNVRCPVCPHIFCAKCAEKMVEEHGDCIFENGCPVCKELCCCGKNRSTCCTRKFHCYKKCPSTKRPAAG